MKVVINLSHEKIKYKKIINIYIRIYYSYMFFKKYRIFGDLEKDSIQVSEPVEFIDEYNGYTVINQNKKIKLTDFGNIEKIRMELNIY